MVFSVSNRDVFHPDPCLLGKSFSEVGVDFLSDRDGILLELSERNVTNQFRVDPLPVPTEFFQRPRPVMREFFFGCVMRSSFAERGAQHGRQTGQGPQDFHGCPMGLDEAGVGIGVQQAGERGQVRRGLQNPPLAHTILEML